MGGPSKTRICINRFDLDFKNNMDQGWKDREIVNNTALAIALIWFLVFVAYFTITFNSSLKISKAFFGSGHLWAHNTCEII